VTISDIKYQSINTIWTLTIDSQLIWDTCCSVLVFCFLFCLSSSCVPNFADYSGLTIYSWLFLITLTFINQYQENEQLLIFLTVIRLYVLLNKTKNRTLILSNTYPISIVNQWWEFKSYWLIDWCLMSDIVTCIHDEVMWHWNRSRYCFPLNMQRNTVICEAIRPMKKKKEFSWFSRVSCMYLFLYKTSKNLQNLTERKQNNVLERLGVK
jgi:hypothetical protein